MFEFITNKNDEGSIMKKRIYLIIIPVVMFISIVILYSIVPSIYRFWFVFRHVLIFALVAYLLIFGSYFIYNKIIKQFDISRIRLWILRIFTICIVSLLLILGSNFQINYIERYEIPPLIACAYYDHFDNLIYSSQFDYICPVLDNYSNTFTSDKEYISFDVTETASGEYTNYESVDNSTVYMYTVLSSHFEYVYNENKNIEKITIEARVVSEESTEEREHTKNYYSGYKKVIENEYNPLLVVSTNTTQEYLDEIDYIDASSYTAPEFSNLDANCIVYESSLSEIEDQTSGYDRYLIDISMTTFEEDIPSTFVFAKGDVEYVTDENSNPDVFDIDFYENDRYIDTSINYKFNYSTIEVIKDLPDIINFYTNDAENRIGSYVYNTKMDSFYLNNYSRLLINLETGTLVEVEDYVVQDEQYFINRFSTSKIIETEIGKKVEYYYTYALSNGSFLFGYNQGDYYNAFTSEGINSTYNFPFSISFKQMYDYKFMMEDVVRIETINIYQTNILIEGFREAYK